VAVLDREITQSPTVDFSPGLANPGSEFTLTFEPSPRLVFAGSSQPEALAEAPDRIFHRETWWLSGVLGSGYRLKAPVRVVLEWHPYGVVAAQDQLLVHAFGDERLEAMESLAERILDQRQDLVERSEDRVAPRLRPLRRRLQMAVVPVSA